MQVQNAEQRSMEAMPKRRKRVLVVEDHTDAGDALTMLIQALGHPVQTVRDGPSALVAMRTTPPDVIIVDIGLPGMDGYELARAVRERPGGRAALLIALTGYVREEDRQRALAAGFDEHVAKPIDFDTLHTLLSRAPS